MKEHYVQLLLLCLSRYCVEALNLLNRRQYGNHLGDVSLHRQNHESDHPNRRDVLTVGIGALLTGAAGLTLMPSPSSAGEVGARITKAVTTSDLGISVRTSVVKGAQVMDQIDGKWEQLSDRFSLGAERNKRDARPKPKVIPDPLPLDTATAKSLLAMADEVFLTLAKLSPEDLKSQIKKVSGVVRTSFERSGLEFSSNEDPTNNFVNGPQFNYALYCHYKAYSDLIIEKGVNFSSFRPTFETQMGKRGISLLIPSYSKPGITDTQDERLRNSLIAVDQLSDVLREKGFVGLIERSTISDDKIEDWLDDMSDLEFSVALDGDVSQNAQILLQEQGFRFYPNFARYAVTQLLQQPGQKVSCLDYYFDTDYNSDPDKFEVKEVLLSCILESV